MMNVLVLDVGTSNMRGILFRESGEKIASAQEKYRVTCMPNGWVEQETSDWEQAMFRILHRIGELSSEHDWRVDAIALTSQRSSVIALDREWKPIQPAIMWQDKRTAEICHRFAGYNDLFLSRCGVRINSVFTAPKMRWIRENQPEIYQKTEKFAVIPDYLLWKLTGKLQTDTTYGSRSLLMNLQEKCWDSELLDLWGIEKEKLCDLIPSGSVAGTLTDSYAKRVGLPAGIPVITAGGDQQCGAIGQGAFERGKVALTAGTGGFLVAATDQIPEDLGRSGMTCNCSSFMGQYVLEGTMLTCCSAFDWFCRMFYPEYDLDEINRIIDQTAAGANDVLCLPYFLGRGTPDWNDAARGVFTNISLDTKKEDFLRALIESICCEFANEMQALREHVSADEVYVNGGLSNSRVFDQILCDTLELPVTRMGDADATARGAFLVACKAMEPELNLTNFYEKIGNTSERIKFLPDLGKGIQYQKRRNEMNNWYQQNYGASLQERRAGGLSGN